MITGKSLSPSTKISPVHEKITSYNTWDVEFGLSGPVSWARRPVQVEGDCHHQAVRSLGNCRCHYGEENKGQRAWAPQGSREATQSSAAAHNIDNWM